MFSKKSKINLKTSTGGAIEEVLLDGTVQKSGNLIRILYSENYEGQNISTTISILPNNSLRILKQGAYSYSFTLKENFTSNFNLNYGGYTVPYSCQTISLTISCEPLSIRIKADYLVNCAGEITNTTFEINCILEGELC